MIRPFTEAEREASKNREIKNSGPMVLRPVTTTKEGESNGQKTN